MRGGVVSLFPTDGSGSGTIGYRLGYASGSSAYLIAAPKSTEVQRAWGSYGTTRGTTSTTNGALNTGTLYGFGSAAHPAAYYCKSLTTGGYNSWYLPAKAEMNTLYSNKSAVPFATANALIASYYWDSTEYDKNNAGGSAITGPGQYGVAKNDSGGNVRAVRQYYAPAAIGDGSATTGYWLGTAGDGVSKLIVAPKSTDAPRAWGSQSVSRGITSTTNGVANTTTLFGFGSAAHPAAYYAKALTTGGYNTWYLPAIAEVMTMYSNKSAVPFATANSFAADGYWSSTEKNGNYAWALAFNNGVQYDGLKNGNYIVRATRRSTI